MNTKFSEQTLTQIAFDMQRFQTNVMTFNETVNWFTWLERIGYLPRMPVDYQMAADRLRRAGHINL